MGGRKRIRENKLTVVEAEEIKSNTTLVDIGRGNKLTEKTAHLSKEMIRIVKERYGLDIFVTDGLRTTEEQQALYAQGRTKPGQIVTYLDGVTGISDHQTGTAFDIAFRNGPLYPSDQATRDKVGEVGMELGLQRGWDLWGRDKPHFFIDGDKGVLIDNGVDVEEIAKEVGEEYGISSDFLICVATAETSLGKNVKSQRNWLNVGNHDSGVTKEFNSLKENFQYGSDALVNGEYLSQWNKIGQLSCGGRSRLGWSECKPTESDYFWASSDYDRQNNLDICMTKRLGAGDYLNFEYK